MISVFESLAIQAGNIALEVRASAHHATISKEDDSPQTRADRLANDLIVEGLTKNFPDIPIISEESPVVDFETRRHWKRFFLVDPLDGTKEYIRGGSDFTVNIALMELGVPVAGVVGVPAQGKLYSASGTMGAVLKVLETGAITRLQASLTDPDAPLKVLESSSHRTAELDSFLEPYTIESRTRIGSSLKFAILAEGKAHLYIRTTPCKEWDTAAGFAIYREALKATRSDLSAASSLLKYNTPSLIHGPFALGLKRFKPSPTHTLLFPQAL